jgi:hypothetical protein
MMKTIARALIALALATCPAQAGELRTLRASDGVLLSLDGQLLWRTYMSCARLSGGLASYSARKLSPETLAAVKADYRARLPLPPDERLAAIKRTLDKLALDRTISPHEVAWRAAYEVQVFNRDYWTERTITTYAQDAGVSTQTAMSQLTAATGPWPSPTVEQCKALAEA